MWECQDVLVGALPHALSEAFQNVERDYLETSKVGAPGSACYIALLSSGVIGCPLRVHAEPPSGLPDCLHCQVVMPALPP